ncbi:MAG: hypothetical protein IKR17_10680 [Bacteroidales bacterium]|nr:hypothetical protein [Bacteroidales bacterium]
MSDNLYHNRYRIPSARATWHDYNGGAYFVTICTHGREHFFGEINSKPTVETFHETSLQNAPSLHKTTEPTMHLNEIGRYADEQLRNVSSHYPYAEIPLWVVMPNHIHAIVIIDGDKTPHDKRVVETFHETSLQSAKQQNAIIYATKMQSWLSVVVRQFKQSITRFANTSALPFAWQTRFHDRIIRDRDEMNRIAQYIENNVAQWESDTLHIMSL